MLKLIRRLGKLSVITAALTYVAILGFVGFRQRSMIYFPDRYAGDARPTEFRAAGVQAVTLRVADGARIAAWWFPPETDSASVLLWCYGNAGDLRSRGFEARHWQRLGVGVLLFDYHGFGASEGEPSERALYLDAAAAYDFLADSAGIAPSRIILFGQSLGGGVASYLAASHAAAGLILESTFTSLADRAGEEYPYLPVGLILSDRFPTLSRAENIRMPALIVHGDVDRTIDIRHGRALAKAFGTRAETWWVPGADHNNLIHIAGENYYTRLKAFIDKAVAAPR